MNLPRSLSRVGTLMVIVAFVGMIAGGSWAIRAMITSNATSVRVQSQLRDLAEQNHVLGLQNRQIAQRNEVLTRALYALAVEIARRQGINTTRLPQIPAEQSSPNPSPNPSPSPRPSPKPNPSPTPTPTCLPSQVPMGCLPAHAPKMPSVLGCVLACVLQIVF